jgi:competence protein ComEC
MDWWLLSFFIGAILSLLLPIVPDLFYLFLFILLACLFLRFSTLGKASGLFFGCVWLIYAGYQYQQAWRNNELDVLTLAQRTQTVVGEVISLPSSLNNTYRFNLQLTKLNGVLLNQAFIVRLSWKNATIEVKQGQLLSLNAKFKPAHGLANTAGFNYQVWLRQKKIVATGYVKKNEDNKVLQQSIYYRQRLYLDFVKVIPVNTLSPLLLALSFGERSTISPKLWQVLQATGTQHLIAISGLHLGLVASGSYFLFLLLVRIFPFSFFISKCLFKKQHQLLSINIRVFPLLLSLMVTFFYGYLADFSLPTTRALVMLLLYWSTRLLGIHFSLKRWLLLTLFILIVISPLSITSASFWLSVYAVCLIFLILWRFSAVMQQGSNWYRAFKTVLIIQLALSLFLIPVGAFFYQQVSIISFAANIIAVPLMSFITIPLSLISVVCLPFLPSLAPWFMDLALYSLDALWWWLSFLADQSFALVSLSSVQIKVISVVISLFGFWLFLLPNHRSINPLIFVNRQSTLKKRLTSCLLILFSVTLIYLLITIKQRQAPLWQVTVLDVGQGLAVVIEKNQKAILYDTGAAFASGFNMVDAVVNPYLQAKGITSLDKVIISHSDNDHAGGLAVLEDKIKIGQLIANHLVTDDLIDNKGVDVCLQGNDFDWQGLTFSFLWPNAVQGQHNDDSCVVLISDGLHKVLLTGDISKKVEQILIGDELTADVLIAPHHGSKTSSSASFIKAVAPTSVIFSAGYLNRWQMPLPEVVSRYRQQNIDVYNTADHGMIKINLGQSSIDIKRYRQDLSPYWFAQ